MHPTVVSAALMSSRVAGFAGAPQTIYSDQFMTDAVDGPIGFKLEAPPVHPVLASITLPGHGVAHASWMRRFPNMQVLIALLRDGFHPVIVGKRAARNRRHAAARLSADTLRVRACGAR